MIQAHINILKEIGWKYGFQTGAKNETDFVINVHIHEDFETDGECGAVSSIVTQQQSAIYCWMYCLETTNNIKYHKIKLECV